MPRNGLGQYNLPTGNPVVPNTSISSNWANTTLTDLANALSTSLAVDGQTVPTANLPMAGFRHTNVANAQNRTDYASAGQVQDAALTALSAVAGSDTITASLVPAPAGYVVSARYVFTPAANNATTTPTLNINGYGAKPMVDGAGAALPIGALVAGVPYEVYFDGTNFRVGGYGMIVNAQTKANSAAATANAALPLTGGTLTGQTSITGAAGTNRQFGWQTATVARWFAGADSSAESGSNAGSNWFLSRFSDAGAFIDSPITVSRATGVASFSMRPSFGAYTPWDSGNLVGPWGSGNLPNPMDKSGGTTNGNWTFAGGPSWTNYPWARSLTVPLNNAIEFAGNAGNYFGVGNAGSTLYHWFAATEGATGSPAYYQTVSNAGLVTYTNRPVFGSATPWDNANLPSPASSGNGYTWNSVFTGSSAGVALRGNFGDGVYLVETAAGANCIVITSNGLVANVNAAAGAVLMGDQVNTSGGAGANVTAVWKLGKT